MTPIDAIVPMTLFALATSASPGPVNVLSAMSGARFGILLSLPYVMGATTSFFFILLLLGFGFNTVINLIKTASLALTLAGSTYMLYLAWMIAADNGHLRFEASQRPRMGFVTGLITQMINPKAWIVSLSAITIYVSPHDDFFTRLLLFGGVFYVICALSLTAWVLVGAQMARFSGNVVIFNRVMAGLLSISVVSIVLKELSLL